MKAIRKHLRLLPAVILLGSGLLVAKGVGLAREASAETSAPAPTQAAKPQAEPASQASADPAADDPESVSASEVDVLTSLSKRQRELDAEAQSLTMRENLLAAAEARVDGKIVQLKSLQSDIETLLGQRDGEEEKQIQSLVKTYASMKPKDAARIFDTLDDRVLLAVAAEMKPDVLGAILAAMQPDQAQKLTVKLADRLKLPAEMAPSAPQQAAATPPQTLAAAAPAVGTPSAPAALSGSVTVPQTPGGVAAAPPNPAPQPDTASAPGKNSAPPKAGG